MCTLSWWLAESERGIVFNRDELRTRARGEAPRVVEFAGAARILMPRDPDAGGTWLGVNDSGLIVALLNNYPFHSPNSPGQISRGQLVVDLLRHARSAAECMSTLQELNTSVYQGFLLFALGRHDGPLAREWDGQQLQPLKLEGEGGLHVLTSSSYRQQECEAFRVDLFAGQSRERALLKEKHGAFHPADPALGPLMVRDDAATDSVTEIVIGKNYAHMWFHSVDGNPPVLSEPSQHRLAMQ
ncbi:NRDE family protein [Coraliomargarita algicola]|uniref:NRDE family protein n=1 Tax=Coraliomargarita algicola TaxID=3092156 RepID=A0ABZ0RN04_9BACT|nr:NRDE family protein [Coraliomargarita sp. J2-16]WPJ96370.1 NRDE family protein [Coraliomargarita sp. J2-16]